MKSSRPSLLSLGAITAAVSSAICCVGPLLLAVTGLGGSALIARAAPFRPHLLAVAFLLLGAAFYATFRKRPSPECDTGCAVKLPSRKQKIVLWIAAAVVIAASVDLFL